MPILINKLNKVLDGTNDLVEIEMPSGKPAFVSGKTGSDFSLPQDAAFIFKVQE